MCELCKQPYDVTRDIGPRSRSQRLQALASLLNQRLLDALDCRSWAWFLVRVYKSYVWTQGLIYAARMGGIGLKMGATLGKRLVEDQTTVLANMLHSMASVLGSPYAELLWCQAVGTLVIGMLSELVYVSLLGCIGGAAIGLVTGQVLAVKMSLGQLGRLAGAVTVGVRGLGGGLLRGVMALLRKRRA